MQKGIQAAGEVGGKSETKREADGSPVGEHLIRMKFISYHIISRLCTGDTGGQSTI